MGNEEPPKMTGEEFLAVPEIHTCPRQDSFTSVEAAVFKGDLWLVFFYPDRKERMRFL